MPSMVSTEASTIAVTLDALPSTIAVTLDAIPEELLAAIVLQLSQDDYHMLTLPVVSLAFWRACTSSDAICGARLASRLRQVVACVVEPNVSLQSNEWGLAHAWGGLQAARQFFELPPGDHDLRPPGWAAAPAAAGEERGRHVHHGGDSNLGRGDRSGSRSGGEPPEVATLVERRLEALASAHRGVPCLRQLLAHCQAAEPTAPAEPTKKAEVLFWESETARLQPPKARRATASERAAQSAASALNLKGEAAAGEAIRKECEAQAQRQVDAAVRRAWKLLPPAKRREWERWAETRSAEARRWRAALAATRRDATALQTLLDPHWTSLELVSLHAWTS